MAKFSVVLVGAVAASTEGYGFNITDERRRPLLSIAYRTEAEAIAARQVIERELASAVELVTHG